MTETIPTLLPKNTPNEGPAAIEVFLLAERMPWRVVEPGSFLPPAGGGEGFSVAALGKLAGGELTFGSAPDLLFLSETPEGDRLAGNRTFLNWLDTRP